MKVKKTKNLKQQAGGSNSCLYHRLYCQSPDTACLLANTTSVPRGIFYRPVAQSVEPPIVCSGVVAGSSPARPIRSDSDRSMSQADAARQFGVPTHKAFRIGLSLVTVTEIKSSEDPLQSVGCRMHRHARRKPRAGTKARHGRWVQIPRVSTTSSRFTGSLPMTKLFVR